MFEKGYPEAMGFGIYFILKKVLLSSIQGVWKNYPFITVQGQTIYEIESVKETQRKFSIKI